MSLTKKQKLLFALVVTLLAGSYFVFTLARTGSVPSGDSDDLTVDVPHEETIATSTSSDALPSALPLQLPARLLISKLSIDALIQHVGLTADRAMGIPTNFKDVAWYKHGTAPGQVGSAVIDGHVDNGLGLPAVFHKIHTLAPGDSISVITEEGTKLSFVVEKSESYYYKDVPTDEVFNRKDKVRLNLITCSGAWLKENRTYDTRLVVYATFVE